MGGLNLYPKGTTLDLDTARIAHRYWATLQTKLTDASRLFLLYLHHSTVRCAASTADNAPEAEFLATGCPGDQLHDRSPDYRLGPGGENLQRGKL